MGVSPDGTLGQQTAYGRQLYWLESPYKAASESLVRPNSADLTPGTPRLHLRGMEARTWSLQGP